ncbi:TPA: hypothetical protein ACHTCS_005916, partial [Pseudomonas aeruginosa]|nr:hypothetical protein [Pseudomonas aeruginosa]
KATGTAAEAAIQVPGRVQSRVNLMTGDKSAGWEHVVSRHFNPEVNASQFTIGQAELRTLLQSKEVVSAPVTRMLESAQGIRYVREVNLSGPIGIDKFSGQPTSTMTVLTDRFGNLITTTPGLLSEINWKPCGAILS